MTSTGQSTLGRAHLRQLTVEAVVDLAAALHEQVFDAAPDKFPHAYNIALRLVNDGVVNVIEDGQPGFSLSGARPKKQVSSRASEVASHVTGRDHHQRIPRKRVLPEQRLAIFAAASADHFGPLGHQTPAQLPPDSWTGVAHVLVA